jgi:hypothetical protein
MDAGAVEQGSNESIRRAALHSWQAAIPTFVAAYDRALAGA